MTTFALELKVCAIELEFGTLVVIEVPNCPSTGVVAGFALHAKHFFMLVVLFMATIAIAGSVFEAIALVAVAAFNRNVLADQRETGLVVVKAGVFPIAVVMALFAGLALLPLVLIVFFVASVAVDRCIPEALQVFVAGVAFEFVLSMGVAQRELGFVVIKTACRVLPIAF